MVSGMTHNEKYCCENVTDRRLMCDDCLESDAESREWLSEQAVGA